ADSANAAGGDTESPFVSTTRDVMPPGIHNAYLFQIFNTISWSVIIGTPMLLFFKHLGAKETILGIAAALPPLCMMLQIPAARIVEQVGYRTFVVRGWTTRTVLILGMVLTAWLPGQIDNTTRMCLMLFFLFGFNVSRGISTAGFLPWLTQLVPEGVRGRFISIDQLSSSLAAVGTLALTSFVMSYMHLSDRISGDSLGRVVYGGIFLCGCIAASISLFFLRRIPDVPLPPPEARTSSEPVPWRAMLTYKPFFRLTLFNIVAVMALSSGGFAWIPLFKERFLLTDSFLLANAAFGGVCAALCLLYFGRIADMTGSKPLLLVSCGCQVIHYTGWALISARVIDFHNGTLAFQIMTSAMGNSLFGLANVRLLMATVPAMGRSHFFALNAVINSAMAGLAPVFCGMMMDLVRTWSHHWGIWEWNKFSLVYVCLACIYLVAWRLALQLEETKAMTSEAFFRELLIRSPARAVSRLIARRPLT
ncbi:MAG: MFS transporter, partial [Candidatus Methylacidiphilales bacterium]